MKSPHPGQVPEVPPTAPARVDDGRALDPLPGDDRWQLVVTAGPPSRRRVMESWLCVADGRIGTRGSLEEDGLGTVPMVLAAGAYGPDQRLVPLSSWVSVDLAGTLEPGRRVLDLRDGTLWREVPVDGGRRALRSARFASLARPGIEVLAVEGPAVTPVTDGGTSGPSTEVVTTPLRLGGGVLELRRTEVRHPADGPCSLHRIAVYRVGTSRRPSRRSAETALEAAWRAGPRALLCEQRRVWRERWEAGDVEITGDGELTRAVRFALFQLVAAAADGGEAAVGPRGLTGPAYAGHVMWDADVFVLPFLAATHTPAARAMLEYRIRRLPPARRAARAAGHEGARFPWESAADGTDVTPSFGVDETGREVPILSGPLEEHITADVAWAAWRLATWTGDWRFLDGPGRPLLVDTARYWASRVRLDGDGRGHIDAVIGPDEYHEDVDDNAFTNNLAAWNLRRAAELVRRTPRRGEGEEPCHWLEVADALVTGYDDETSLYQQFAGFDRLEPVMAASLGRVPFAGDLVLGRSRTARSQLLKQADVLMLHHMVPEAVAPGSLAPNLDHYLPRTCHGSSLSPSIHAAVLARAGRTEDARRMLELATRIDLDDLTGTTASGLHLANSGGIWQAIVHGFAGLGASGPDDAELRLDPHLPADWGELRIRLRWHQRRLALRCTPSSVHVATDRPVVVRVWDRSTLVEPPGRWLP